MSVKVKSYAIMALVLLIAVLVAGCSSSEPAVNSSDTTNSSATDTAYKDLKGHYDSLMGLPDRVAAIDNGIKGMDPHTVNQTARDAYEAEIDSCIATLDECEASLRLYSAYQPNSTGQSNQQVTDAITQTNVKVLGDAPAIAMGNLYIATSQALENATRNATRNQLLTLKTSLDPLRAGQ